MIEMTNLELLGAASALGALTETPLPALASLKVVRIARAVETAARDVHLARQQTIDRFTERDEAGAPVPVRDDSGAALPDQVRLTDPAAFQREMTTLLEATTRLEVQPLRVAELGAEATLAPRTLLHLGPLVEPDPEP